jgi:hypothetical protein
LTVGPLHCLAREVSLQAMKIIWLLLAACASGLFLGGLGWLIWPARAISHDQAPQPKSVSASSPMVGTPSCSARGCHGGIAARTGQNCGQNEFTLWLLNDDPHTRAFQVLKEDKARRIADQLKIPDPAAAPQCLACHTTPWAAADNSPPMLVERGFGVGCESCHGPAQKWLAAHTRPEWQKLSPQKKQEEYGLMDVADPFSRMSMCVGCHVGAAKEKGIPVRDVNHDLIAAGHPRMHFEATSFLANLPLHWNQNAPQRLERQAAMSWAAGQIVAAQAALRLLEHRATDKASPWPEFAEYSCYACHHDLQQESTRQEHYRQWSKQRPDFLAALWKPGNFPWGGWYMTGPRILAGPGAMGVPPAAGLLMDLEKAISAGLAPDGAAIAKKALSARVGLESLAMEIRTGRFMGGLVNQVVGELADPRNHQGEWENAEQAFLACAVLRKDLRVSQSDLESLLPLRGFPAGFDGPRNFQPAEFWPKLKRIIAGAAGK